MVGVGPVDYTRDRLAAYKRPRRVIFLSALPATSTGKIMRRKLADAAAAGVKGYTLAFLTPKSGCTPEWEDGGSAVGAFAPQISAMQAADPSVQVDFTLAVSPPGAAHGQRFGVRAERRRIGGSGGGRAALQPVRDLHRGGLRDDGPDAGYQGLCLDDTGYGGAGTQVQIWSCASTANQQWDVP